MQMSIIKKVTSLLLLMLLVAIANVTAIYFYQIQQRHDAHIVNVAGRQRMLSQRISKLVLSVANGNDRDRKLLSEDIELYDNSLEAIWHGGKAMEIDIPPALMTMEKLFQKNKNLWVLFKENAEIIAKDTRDNLSFQEALSYIEDENRSLLQASDDVVIAYDSLPDARNYAHEINIAGRQRVLSQQMAKYAFSIAIGDEKDREDLKQAIKLYEESFLAIRNGGASIPWGKEIKLPPSSVKKTLEAVERLWNVFKEKASIIQNTPSENETFKKGTEYIRLNSNELLKVSSLVTLTFDELFSRKALLLRRLLLALLGLDILVFIIGCFIAVKIIEPLQSLSAIAEKIGAGDFTARAQVDADDEIGNLAMSFNKMTEDLQKTMVSRDYVDNIMKSMIDALIVVDPKANIKMVNQATLDLLGYKEEELNGKAVSLVITEEESLFKGARLKKLIEQGSIRNFNMAFKTKTGERIPVSFSGSVMKSKEGKIEGIVCIARDMREMKRLLEKEKELTSVAMKAAQAEKEKTVELKNTFSELEKSQDVALKYMEDLEVQRNEFEKQYEETKQKSRSLEQAQAASLNIMEDLDLKRKEVEEREKKLKETQAMLVQAGKLSAMGQLGAGIAHELNQPLAAIRGYTQVLIEEIKNNDPHLADLKIIEEQTGRMGTIVNNIRSFARDSKFTWDLIDIHKPIEDAFMLLTTQLTNHNIEVVKDYSRDIPQIKADSNQLQQVFINLITNAKDELDKNNGGKIWVSTRILKLGKQKTDWKVEISFKNEGTPIPKEIMHLIFDPFFTTKGPGKGTGLGLSISYGIIKDHQGEIMVANKEDGVEFVVSLPVDAKGSNAKNI